MEIMTISNDDIEKKERKKKINNNYKKMPQL